ncbi:hypothetical protein HK102_013229, partial [Quaeritorhiza haematococci]
PSHVSPGDFWLRYFFRVAELDQFIETRKQLVKDATEEDEEDFAWDSTDDEDSEGQPSPSTAAAPELPAANADTDNPAPTTEPAIETSEPHGIHRKLRSR